jgi:hypothetical protein
MSKTITAETLSTFKTVELRKMASKEYGIKGMSSARKEQLVPAILAVVEQRKADEPAPKPAKAVRTAKGVKGKVCAGCGQKPVDQKTQGRDSILCTECFEKGSLENEHADGLHDGAPVDGCPDCVPAKADSSISPKALRFEQEARAAGWSALTRLSADGGISLVTARASDGRELELRWAGKVCVDGQNFLKRADGKRVKVRNASAARKILGGADF